MSAAAPSRPGLVPGSASVKPGRGFEWFVAWRHLRDPERRSRRVLKVGLAIILLGLAAYGASYLVDRHAGADPAAAFLRSRPSLIAEYLRNGGIVAVGLGGLVAYLGVLFASFTVFTAISIFGVFLGTAAPIVVLSVMSGFEADLKGKIRGAKADIVITRADDAPFTDWARVRTAIAGTPGVAASTPYIESEVMLDASGTPASVIMRGIDPATAPGVLDLERIMREGHVDDLAHPERVKSALPPLPTRGELRETMHGDEDEGDEDARPAKSEAKVRAKPAIKDAATPAVVAQKIAGKAGALDGSAPTLPRETSPPVDSSPRPTIILGDELYGRNLRVFVGSEIGVVCPLCGLSPSGARPKLLPFRVAGHFYSGMYEFDSKLAYISLGAAQRFLGMTGEVTGIDVRTLVPDRAGEVADAIAARLGKGYEVRSWQELNRGLFAALRLEKIAMFIVLTFIALVASFSIISNLIMLVTEKAREVAILKAMGAGDGAILRVFFAEGLYIGLLGLTVGAVVGVGLCLLIQQFGLPLPTDVYYINRLPVVMRVGEILTVAGLALLLCCLATVYPAVLASRMRPVDGLRYE